MDLCDFMTLRHPDFTGKALKARGAEERNRAGLITVSKNRNCIEPKLYRGQFFEIVRIQRWESCPLLPAESAKTML